MQTKLPTNGRSAILDSGHRKLYGQKINRRNRAAFWRAFQSSSNTESNINAEIENGEVEYKDGLTDIAFIALCR